jgi:hypothetical protein
MGLVGSRVFAMVGTGGVGVVGGMDGVGGTDRVGKMGGVSWYGGRWNVTGGSGGMRCEK